MNNNAFNFEKIDTVPFGTRNGLLKGKILHIKNNPNNRYPLVVLLESEDYQREYVKCYSKGGECEDGLDENFNLVMKSIRRTGWVNVYKSTQPEYSAIMGAYVYKSHQDATKRGNLNMMDTIQIFWDEYID